jgi:CBS domain-containing protein
MKSLETLPISRAARRYWLAAATDEDDEVTAELNLIGALVRGAPIVVDAATPLAELRRLLVEERAPAIAVVDAHRNLRGVVTRTDVLRALDTRDELTAADAMSGFVFALPADATIEHAAALMAHEGVGQVIVTGADGALVGMVSALDIARHCAVRAGYLAA